MKRSLGMLAALAIIFYFWHRPPKIGDCQALSIQIERRNPTAEEPSSPTDTYWGHGLRISMKPESQYKVVSWSVEGNAISDFDEQVSDGLNEAQGWNTTAFSPTLEPSFQVYFKPALENSTETRKVTLTAKAISSGSVCQCQTRITIRPYKRPAELYSSDHRDRDEPAQGKGRVIDAHYVWHTLHMLGMNGLEIHRHPSFLHWHHLFVDRYVQWRKLFMYETFKAWEPGSVVDNNMELFLHGPGQEALPMGNWQTPRYTNWNAFEDDIVGLHNQVHLNLQNCKTTDFGCFLGVSSPKSELFWRFHLYLDNIYQKYCGLHPAECPNTSGPN